MRNERVAIDSNILVQILGGNKAFSAFLKGREVVASTIVRMEALIYHGEKPKQQEQVLAFLDRCELVEIHRSVQDIAVDLRVRFKLSLPDAIIGATAGHLDIPLITADAAFAKLKPEFDIVLLKA
jgi:tRNA(fMet)-specific endonuclease VapC